METIEALGVLADEYNMKILLATQRIPRTATYLSKRFNIPIAACYRRMKALIDAGLVRIVKRILNQSGKRESVFKSQLKSVSVHVENGSVKISMQLTNGQQDDCGGSWSPIVEYPASEPTKLISECEAI